MWERRAGDKVLTFHLAGINNQNFLMRDEETGSYWQQVSGECVFGPLKGAKLKLVPADEVSFGIWKREHPDATVLAPVKQFESDYAKADWEEEIKKLKTVVSTDSTPLKPRDLVVGLELEGGARAYPVDRILKQSPVMDKIAGVPIVVIAGPDKKSVRIFEARASQDTAPVEMFRKTEGEWSLTDARGNQWNFQGCAEAGPAKGTCLRQVAAIKDYWFDWWKYHPQTSLYRR